MSTTPRPLRRPRRSLAGVVAASALLLSGCGATGWNPGVGVRAGDETISNARVEQITAAYCEALSGQLEEAGQAIEGRLLRGGVAGELALALAAEQLAAEHGVDVAGQYDRQVAAIEKAVADLPEDQQEAVVEVEAARVYVAEAKAAVGRALLIEEGNAAPAQEEAVARGEEAFADWLAEHEMRFDPSYGVALEDGALAPVDTGLSFADSDAAEQGGKMEADPGYAAGLPSSQRCG